MPLLHADSGITSAWVQVGDPISAPSQAVLAYNDYRQTTLVKVANVLGRRSNIGILAVPTLGWPFTAVAGARMIASTVNPTLAILAAEFPAPATTEHGKLPNTPKGNSPPPRPCDTTNQIRCDTQATTGESPVPWIAGADPDVDYRGPNDSLADSHTPYMALNANNVGAWGFLNGRIVDSTNNGIWGVPIRVREPVSDYIIEKITNNTGDYSILLPFGSGTNVELRVNDPSTSGSLSPIRFYDPRYETPTQTSFALAYSGNPPTHTIATLPLTSLVGAGGATGLSISGTLSAQENTAVRIVGVKVQLRDAKGKILQVVETSGVGGSEGQYTFPNITGGASYFVVPVLDRTWKGNRSETLVPLAGASVNNIDFLIAGTPARVTISDTVPGTLVLVTNGAYNATNPPDFNFATIPATAGIEAFTGIVGKNPNNTNSVTIQVKANATYRYVCWRPDTMGTYTRIPNSGSNNLGTLASSAAGNGVCQ